MFGLKSEERPWASTPVLDTIVSSSLDGMFARSTRSTSATCCSVFSTRWPTGARSVMRNWLSSETGRNSVPIFGIRRTEAVKIRRIPLMKTLRCPKTQRSESSNPRSMDSYRVRLQSIARTNQRGIEPCDSCSGFRYLKHSAGVTVLETKNEVNRAMAIVSVSGISKRRAMPTTKKMGKNTTTVVTVDAKIGMATSRAASRIASHRRWFVLRCRWMFSSSTIESSTSRPMPSANPPSVKTFSVWPVK